MRTHVINRWLRLWRWLVAHPWLLLGLYVGVLLLLGFISLLAEVVPAQQHLLLEDPLRQAVQRVATPELDASMLAVSWLGSRWGVLPLDIAILLGLVLRRRTADGLFFRLAVGGVALLSQTTTLVFSHEQPKRWPSAAPEQTFRYPSVHALGSMAAVAAVVVLLWPTRWRVAALVVGGLFTLLVGLSRLYLGIQYPSDVLAGWAASLAWVLGLSVILYGRLGKPATAPPDAPPPQALDASLLSPPSATRTDNHSS